jgi:predicted nucleic acid-binding protein
MAGPLLDTGALYALADRDDKWHARMVTALGGRPLPVTVLTEACYLLARAERLEVHGVNKVPDYVQGVIAATV